MSKLIIATVAAFFAVEAKAETAISCKPAWDANNYLKQAAEKGFPGVVVSDTEGLKVTYFAEPRKGAITKFISASYDKETETFRCNYEDAVGNSYYYTVGGLKDCKMSAVPPAKMVNNNETCVSDQGGNCGGSCQ